MTSSPAPIKRLEETVVNRIAAGEVIQRPANALKELLENSLDAESTNILITVKDGGLKYLQIQDNGTGIRKDDLEIVCERFTTSKLTTFEDLSTIGTFGFRGEALASIAHIAHLTIVTRTVNDQCAYRACYENGKVRGNIKPCAGNKGTQITIEDLFYNVATRKRILTNLNDEYLRIAEVVSRYAVHNPTVGFMLRKQGERVAEIRTNANLTHLNNIRSIYGSDIAKSLEEITTKDVMLQFNLSGYVSKVNFSIKRHIFLLFINNRLVDSQALRKALDQVYSLYLPKGSHPFIYLSLKLEPRNVDVNIHPTKHEVHFLHEDSIIDKIKCEVESKLLASNTSRVFYTQTKLPCSKEIIPTGTPVADRSQSTQANYLVRTDSKTQKIDKFLTSPANTCDSIREKDNFPMIRREIGLTSVYNLRKELKEDESLSLKNILENITFVGCATNEWMVVQRKTELYMINCMSFLEEMFYQILLTDLGNFSAIKYSEPLNIKELILLALEAEEMVCDDTETSKEEMAQMAATILQSKADMLNDYFSMEIDSNGNLITIPSLLEKYKPPPEGLPVYMLRLALQVDWEHEEPCFKSLCKETSLYYSNRQFAEYDIGQEEEGKGWFWTLEHILLPNMKKHLRPSRKLFENRCLLQIASLPQLYKVFERC